MIQIDSQTLMLHGSVFGIPTTYGGVPYASRLHAQWAAVLTDLGEVFDPAPKEYHLTPICAADYFGGRGDGIRTYLRLRPDFYLLSSDQFLVLRPEGFFGRDCDEEDELLTAAGRLSYESRSVVVVVAGEPRFTSARRAKRGDLPYYAVTWDNDQPHLLCECGGCGAVGFAAGGVGSLLGCTCGRRKGPRSEGTARIRRAFEAARMGSVWGGCS